VIRLFRIRRAFRDDRPHNPGHDTGHVARRTGAGRRLTTCLWGARPLITRSCNRSKARFAKIMAVIIIIVTWSDAGVSAIPPAAFAGSSRSCFGLLDSPSRPALSFLSFLLPLAA